MSQDRPPANQEPDDVGHEYEQIIAQVSQTHPTEVSDETKTKYLEEVFSLLLSENVQPIYLAVKRILTISFVPILFVLVIVWLGIVIVFVWMAAFTWRGFSLPPSVLIALITSTTVTVLGLFHYVARWLFAVHPKDPPDEPSTSN